MSVGLYIVACLASAVVMMAASRLAITHAISVAQRLSVPRFYVGVALVAVGTDIPEIVNSVISSYLGHGDVNVGDSVGSVFTQGTLILGLYPILASMTVTVSRRSVSVQMVTLVCLAIGIWLMHDGNVSRLDAMLLTVCWLVGLFLVLKTSALDAGQKSGPSVGGSALKSAAISLFALALVGGAAVVLVKSIVAISADLGIPEYVLSFFAASIGTSLPELFVEYAALRRREHAIALGDIFGSCLVDASLSIAAGPLLFPIAVSVSLAVNGSLLAAVAVVLASLLLLVRPRLDSTACLVLIGIYLAGYLVSASA
jgi:cation:H+ antiporter